MRSRKDVLDSEEKGFPSRARFHLELKHQYHSLLDGTKDLIAEAHNLAETQVMARRGYHILPSCVMSLEAPLTL